MATVIEYLCRSNHELYTVEIAGEHVDVTITASASVVRRWLSTTLYFCRHYVQRERFVVGLGVQWTPGGSDPPPDTLQLGAGRRCLIFQLSHADAVPRSLRRFLSNPYHVFVGFWNHSDHHKLKYCSGFGLEMWKDPLDLRYVAETENDENLVQASVEEIVEKSLGFEVEQKHEISVSNWNLKNLSDDQVAYATLDAYCAFLVGRNSSVWRYRW